MNVKKGKPWDTFEIEAIVSAYKEMLWLQVLGHKFSKTEFNSTLQRKIDRSKASIEFKFRNISGVMSILQLPEVRGYLPAENFQKALFDCVLEWDRKEKFKPIVDRLMIRPQRAIDTQIMYVDPPGLDQKLTKNVGKHSLRTIRGIHFPSYGDWRYRLGKAGEEYVFHAEIDRLFVAGRNDLSKKVCWNAESNDEDAGFDILSFDNYGNERLIGVKTTIGSVRNPFFLTSNEYTFSEANQSKYRLIRLFEFGTNPKAYRLSPPLGETLRIRPSVYEASL